MQKKDGININGIFLQKAILFVKMKQEEETNFIQKLKNKLPKVSDLAGEDKVVKEMESQGYIKMEVQYNPSSVQIAASADIVDNDEAAGTDGDSSGRVALNSGSVMSFELIVEAVDMLADKSSVRKQAEGMIALMMSSETRRVTFYYGGILFSGELQDIGVQYTMFDEKGNPVWAVISVSIQENEEEKDEKPAQNKSLSVQKPVSNNYDDLETEYGHFRNPVSVIKINQKDISENKSNLSVSDLEIELTCGYEASIATFSIYNAFDKDKSVFRTEELKKYIFLGSSVSISTGYGEIVKNVFRGFISKVNFIYEGSEMPHIQVTCMDVKGIMMAGSSAKQLTSVSFGDAVKEIFQKAVYTKMQSEEILTNLSIAMTPDKKNTSSASETSDKTIEIVNESDYEFVVRAAKKFNYEFYVESGTVIFRKAKSATTVLTDLKLNSGLKKFDIEYDITGLVESVHVRGMDTGKMKLIKSKQKLNNKISMGNKAKQLLKKSEKVYIDPTVRSQQDAQYRGEFLLEDISYRFGTLVCECIGMPELKPGNYVKISGLGAPADNEFYITSVKHSFSSEDEYKSHITAKASKLQ